jgi:hypothetical protein
MNRLRIEHTPVASETDWIPFPGGELEGKRPRALCPSCRSRAEQAQEGDTHSDGPSALCFQCYLLELQRDRKIKAAGDLDTATEARFQSALPFEPVNTSRLARLQTERQAAQARARIGVGGYIEKRRRAQIEARHALARVFQGLKDRRLIEAGHLKSRESALEAATRAAELQLPEAWLPFVVSR